MSNIRVVAYQDHEGQGNLIINRFACSPKADAKHIDWPTDTAEKAKAAAEFTVNTVHGLLDDLGPLAILFDMLPITEVVDTYTIDEVLAGDAEQVYFDGELDISGVDALVSRIQELLAKLNEEDDDA